MPTTPFNIPVFTTGLEKDVESYLIPDDATANIINAYYWRKKIIRRRGNTLIGRITEIQNNVNANVLVAGNTTYSNTLTTPPIDKNSITIEIEDTGAAVIYTFTDDGSGNLSAGAGTSGTVNYTTGVYIINFPALVAPAGQYNVNESWESYPLRPCMAILNAQRTNINFEDTVVFDTRVANIHNKTNNTFDDISYDTTATHFNWSGSDHDFFWGWNYYTQDDGTGTFRNLLWVTNNIIADGISYWNGVSGSGWVRLMAAAGPAIGTAIATKSAPNYWLYTCKLIISYRNRLLSLNTTEYVNGKQITFQNRVRWCQNGTPLTQGTGADATAWHDDVAGKGGFIDAPTNEAIISCRFFKNTLIVFFERSTWQLVYSGNDVLPFFWKRLNIDFGCESMKSTVPFDDVILSIGDKAITAANSVKVERIDLKIPDEVFNFDNTNFALERIAGIRDFQKEIVYWTIPNNVDKTFPNQLLIFNYRDNSYSIFEDSITAFGNIQFEDDLKWEDATFLWKDPVDYRWNSFVNKGAFPFICAGNQQGFIFVINFSTMVDSESLVITNITQANPAVVTSTNHNFKTGDLIYLTDVEGMTEVNNKVFKINNLSNNTFIIDEDSTTFTPYIQNGFITVIKNFEINTKKFNPWYQEGKRLRLDYIDLYLNQDGHGLASMDLLIDDTVNEPIDTLIVDFSKNYGPTITNNKIWARIYTNAIAQFVQLKFYLDEDQIRDNNKNLLSSYSTTFDIHSLTIWIEKIRRLYDSFNI